MKSKPGPGAQGPSWAGPCICLKPCLTHPWCSHEPEPSAVAPSSPGPLPRPHLSHSALLFSALACPSRPPADATAFRKLLLPLPRAPGLPAVGPLGAGGAPTAKAHLTPPVPCAQHDAWHTDPAGALVESMSSALGLGAEGIFKSSLPGKASLSLACRAPQALVPWVQPPGLES